MDVLLTDGGTRDSYELPISPNLTIMLKHLRAPILQAQFRLTEYITAKKLTLDVLNKCF